MFPMAQRWSERRRRGDNIAFGMLDVAINL
jgi:hypothetical protein